MRTKSKIVELLHSGAFVSGEELAQKCGISRAAVWKSVSSLREDGYGIEAVTNKGYRIVSFPDKLSAEKIAEAIRRRGGAPGTIFCFDSIDSTNSEANRRAVRVGAFRDANGDLTSVGAEFHRSLYVSAEQTSGRGRLGRVFASPQNTGVYFTLLYAPRRGVEKPALFTAAAAVAVAKAVDSLYGTECKIKWVNDVFSEGKKISGILTEGISHLETGRIECVIVGIGINIKDSGFSGELGKIAGTIESALSSCGKKMPDISKNELVGEVAASVLSFYEAYENADAVRAEEIMREYKARSFLIGKTVSVNPVAGASGESYKATVVDVSDGAELVVRTESGEVKSLYSGEVSLHSNDFA